MHIPLFIVFVQYYIGLRLRFISFLLSFVIFCIIGQTKKQQRNFHYTDMAGKLQYFCEHFVSSQERCLF